MTNYYEKRPAVRIDGWCVSGWNEILQKVSHDMEDARVLIVEGYTGIYYHQIKQFLQRLANNTFIDTADLLKTEDEIRELTDGFLTEDVLFGHLTYLELSDFFDSEKLMKAQHKVAETNGKVIIFGFGASLVYRGGLLIYADMPRWEIQQRMRRKEVNGIGVNNHTEYISLQYKRGYFNDWKVLDRHKQTLFNEVDYWLDTCLTEQPKLIDKKTFHDGLEKAATSPFRVVPFFDPAPWGGQWMKRICGLDPSVSNYGWCFDCVPEENSLLLRVGDTDFEMPAVNLVYLKSKKLLGEFVEARFGKEFPIRFDFLDTIDGGNLSLQVHPTNEFSIKNFGIAYTQDESYYMVDALEDATVYLGLKSGIDPEVMFEDLGKAQSDKDASFNAEKYVNILPARKHDHFLIPAGTIHCSGKNSVVLEISATPNLFTFKLWDWNRLGLDGKPRPLNIKRGHEVLEFDRDTTYTQNELVNQFEVVNRGDGWVEEKTGLHKTQFIETRRHTFSKPVLHETKGSVNVLNLVEGNEIIIESTDGSFEPTLIHYAETFIIPASVQKYIIKPHGPSEGKECITIKAYVRGA